MPSHLAPEFIEGRRAYALECEKFATKDKHLMKIDDPCFQKGIARSHTHFEMANTKTIRVRWQWG